LERTGLSKTDIVNRAISVYEFADAELGLDQDQLVPDSQRTSSASM